MDPRLHKLLGGDELAALRRRLRRHFERVEVDKAPGVLRLAALNAVEREALALLTGRSPRDTKSMQVDVNLLDAMLREAGIAASLRAALEQIGGPVVHLASVRAAANASWVAVATACTHPALTACLQTPATMGLLKRLARQDTAAGARLLEDAAAVLRRLPAGGAARAQLAAETLGNAHALDDGQATATLVLAAWRRIETRQSDAADAADARGDKSDGRRGERREESRVDDIEDDLEEDLGERRHGRGEETRDGTPEEAPEQAPEQARKETREEASAIAVEAAPDERSRDVWARAGVLVNELARPALLLNVPVQADETPICLPGEPAYLSLRRLLRRPPRWAVAGRTVFVCENPNLVAIAADRLGGRCAPLACTDGMPSAAQRTLLTQLAQAGASLRYHGDFDWPGVQIANHVMRVCKARPWRFAAADYEAAEASATHTRRELAQPGVVASWDATLAPAMRRSGLAIAEEAVAAALLEDLRQD